MPSTFITTNMLLTIWDSDDDFFDGSQLAGNWTAVDVHNHTPGHGTLIPSGGLADGAITTAKIAADAVTPDKIPNNSITGSELANNAIATQHLTDASVTTPKIADGAVTPAKIAGDFLPIGFVGAWYRPNSSVPLPTGWEICDGRAWSTIINAWGVSTGNIPNLVNKFILGAALTGIGTDPASPPDIGASGGSHTRDFLHTHTVTNHSHTVDAHHHGISVDGAHKHRWLTTIWDGSNQPIGTTFVDGMQRGTAVPGSAGTRQSFYIPELNRNEYYGENVNAPMETVAGHSHGTITGDAGSNTSVATGVTTGNGLANSTDVRPAFVGLLYIMRVRNT